MIDYTPILSQIAKLEADLAKLKIALGVENVAVPTKQRKQKAAKDPNAEKKAPNVWIQFTQKVAAALKAAEISTGAAPVSKQFASFLKDKNNAYAEWTDESIVAEWATWEKPEVSKMAKAASESESDGGSVKKATKATKATKASEASDSEATGEKKERKKRAPMTDEAKAAMKAKRAATVAAKKATETGAGALPASTASSDSEDAAEEAAAPAPAAPAAPAAKSTTFKPKKVVKSAPTFTIEQLQDFDAIVIDGADFGRNVRGDMVDTDGIYVGQWDGTKIVKAEKPADWEKVQPGSASA